MSVYDGGVISGLAALPAKIKEAQQKFLDRASFLVHRESIRNCPISPTQGQINSVRKTTRNTSKQKKATATSRPKPGGLRNSIEREVKTGKADIFVAVNSMGGQYAIKMHDEKGMSWRNRGINTIAHGARADEKFIERALKDNEDNLTKILLSEMNKVKL